jgi:hypothetical protein
MKKFRARAIIDFELPENTLVENVETLLKDYLESKLLHTTSILNVTGVEITGSYDIIPGDQHRHGF